MKIVIDYREKLGLPKEYFPEGYEPIYTNLEIGDVLLSDTCCIEIKRVSATNNDLRDSLFDGRLHEQMHQMMAAYDRNILILEITEMVNFYSHTFGEKSWETLKMSVLIQYGVHIVYTRSIQETVDQIVAMCDKIAEGPHYREPIHKDKIPPTLPELRQYLLSGLIGVSRIRSKVLLEEFETPMEVFMWILNRQRRKVKGFDEQFFKKNKTILTD